MGYKVLMAFVEEEFCTGWREIWRGDSLRELSKEELHYFIGFYGLDNLRLSFTYEDIEPYPDFDPWEF